jgi:hypothetical protein
MIHTLLSTKSTDSTQFFNLVRHFDTSELLDLFDKLEVHLSHVSVLALRIAILQVLSARYPQEFDQWSECEYTSNTDQKTMLRSLVSAV